MPLADRVVRRIRSTWIRIFGWKPYSDAVTPNCALCGSEERDVVGRRVLGEMRYHSVVCRRCGLVYLCPRPSREAFENFYRTLFSRYGGGPSSDYPSERGSAVADFLAANLDIAAQRKIVDVGCGDGSLLRAFAVHPEFGRLRLTGIDPGWPEPGPTTLEERGVPIEISRQQVEDFAGIDSDVTLLVLYDVLEHLLEPQATLKSLHAGTSPETAIFISTNCLDHWDAIPPAGWETYYLRLAHTYTFSRATLEALLAGTGWRTSAWAPAAKGDQWILAVRSEPEPERLAPIPGESARVRTSIEQFRRRSSGR